MNISAIEKLEIIFNGLKRGTSIKNLIDLTCFERQRLYRYLTLLYSLEVTAESYSDRSDKRLKTIKFQKSFSKINFSRFLEIFIREKVT